MEGWRDGGVEGWSLVSMTRGWGEGTTRDDPGTTQNCPKLLSGPNEKMPLNSRTCQPDRCREGGPRQGAKGKDRDARGRQGGMNRGGRERVPPQRLKCCREWSSGTLAEQKMLTLVRQGQ